MIKNSVYNNYKNLDDKKFKEAVGIPKILFETIVPVLAEKVNKLISLLADSGYQGITNIFKNSMIPKKKSKYNPLTNQDKELNKLISSIRITIEHVNCQLKIFRILSEKYRSRIKTFNKRAILICYFYNYCL